MRQIKDLIVLHEYYESMRLCVGSQWVSRAGWIGLFLLSSLGDSRTAHSHRPRLPEKNHSYETAFAIGDAEISWALYASLKADKVDYYSFELQQDQVVEPQILVEDERHLDGFGPILVLYGSSISGSTEPPADPVVLPLAVGYRYAASMDESYFESFTRKSYRRTARLRSRLPAGSYGVAVFDPAGHSGDYVLTIGEAEQFDGSDFPPMFTGCGRIFY